MKERHRACKIARTRRVIDMAVFRALSLAFDEKMEAASAPPVDAHIKERHHASKTATFLRRSNVDQNKFHALSRRFRDLDLRSSGSSGSDSKV
jgi:hypothetical protein